MNRLQWVKRCDPRARALADRHYSRQTIGAAEFLPPGRTLVLYRPGVVWGVVENLDPRGNRRWRVTIFRNETRERSSELVEEATMETRAYWRRHYGAEPAIPLTTEVDPRKVASRNPGWCFIVAGWRRVRIHRGLHVLEAPCAR